MKEFLLGILSLLFFVMVGELFWLIWDPSWLAAKVAGSTIVATFAISFIVVAQS